MAKPYYTQMTYGNVVTGKYVFSRFDLEQIKAMYEDFTVCIREHGFSYVGPVTFYMETIEGLTRVRIFVPTKGYKPLINNKLGFESFYGHEHVICMQIGLNEYVDIDRYIKIMAETCKQDGYTMYGPIYHVFVPDDKGSYFLLKAGIYQENS